MVFSNEDKIIIQNDYEEKGWSAYKIWKNHPSKKWDYYSVKRLMKKFRETGSMDRGHGSGRPRTVSTEEEDIALLGDGRLFHNGKLSMIFRVIFHYLCPQCNTFHNQNSLWIVLITCKG